MNEEQEQTLYNCTKYDSEDFRRARREKTFPVFINNTDEKDQTIKVFNNSLSGLIYNLTSITVSDVGVGEGYLSEKVADFINGTCSNTNITYYGMDKIEGFINR
ncbi:MAG: hypothetical protein AABY27_05210 [Pseudomonadota bacterium]